MTFMPLILYPQMFDRQVGQGDCDCACNLDLPAVIAASPAGGSHDCDCACAADSPLALAAEAASGSFDCDCACASDSPFASAAEAASGSVDCDCACALDMARGPAGQVVAGQWLKESHILSMPLDNGWQACFNPTGPVGMSVLNADAGRVLAAFDAPTTPRGAAARLQGISPAAVRDTAQQLARIGLLRPAVVQSAAPARPATLSAWLHVTEACNLRCAYCYVHKRPQTMSLEVGRYAVDRLVDMAGRHGYRSLKLKYAGGEPTLNFPLIEALHAHAECAAAGSGLALEEVLLTNGVGVTDAMLDFVVQAGMRLMVSLDGGPDTHDRLRARPDGRSTYTAVSGTVERAMERGLRPNISITLTALNLGGAAEAAAFALERDLPFNLNFYRTCPPANGEGFPGPLRAGSTELVEAMREILAVVRAHPTYPLPLTAILDRTRLDVPHQHACSAGQDYIVVSTAGQVSACQMLLEEPWSHLADEDPLGAVRQRGAKLFQGVDADPDCRACPWRAACAGGCPLLRHTALHDDYCQVYRALFPELIRLEANRLIATYPA